MAGGLIHMAVEVGRAGGGASMCDISGGLEVIGREEVGKSDDSMVEKEAMQKGEEGVFAAGYKGDYVVLLLLMLGGRGRHPAERSCGSWAFEGEGKEGGATIVNII